MKSTQRGMRMGMRARERERGRTRLWLSSSVYENTENLLCSRVARLSQEPVSGSLLFNCRPLVAMNHDNNLSIRSLLIVFSPYEQRCASELFLGRLIIVLILVFGLTS